MSQFSRRKFMFASGITAAASILTNACSKKVEGEANPTTSESPAVSIAAETHQKSLLLDQDLFP